MEKELKETFQKLHDVKNKGVSGIPSGLKSLDQRTRGFQKGEVVVISGRPASGKTALALGFARTAAQVGNSVLYLSMDKSKEHLTRRLLSQMTDFHFQKISNADMNSQEWVSLSACAAKLSEYKIKIYDERMDFALLCMAIIDHKTKYGLDLVVIDYLQGMSQDHSSANDFHKNYTNLAQTLKDFARSLNIAIIVLSSASRNLETREDKRPTLADLTFTGTLEVEADLILMLYRECMYNNACEHPERAEIIIAKQSSGPTGTVYVNFIRELMLFEGDLDLF